MQRHRVGKHRVDSGRRAVIDISRGMTTICLECTQPEEIGGESNKCRNQYNQRKGKSKSEYADKSERGNRDKAGAFKGSPAHAHDSIQHDGEDRSLKSEKEGLYQADVSERDIDET